VTLNNNFIRKFYDASQGSILYGFPPSSGGGGTVTGANNGLTDIATIVKFGQDVGAGGDPAKFLNDRQIPVNGFALEWKVPTTQFIEYFTPPNFDPITFIPGRYATWLGTFNVNAPDPRLNVVISDLSYNYNPGGSHIIAGEAAFAFKAEQYFNADGTHLMEFHRPEVIDDAGIIHRIDSKYMHRPDGYTYGQSEMNQFDYRTNLSASDIWLTAQRGNTDGATILEIISGFDVNSIATLRLSNGVSGQRSIIQQTISAMVFTSHNGGGDMDFRGARNFLSTYIAFSGLDYFGDNNTYFFAKTNNTGKGYIFESSTGTNFLWVNDQYTAAFGYLSGSLGVNSSGFVSSKYAEKAANYLITDLDHVINFTASPFTATLPTAVWIATLGKEYWIKNTGVGIVTVATTGGQTIDGAATALIAAGGTLHVKSTNANWVSLA
jgi:hypothetical protein